jgi:hypothetical protein
MGQRELKVYLEVKVRKNKTKQKGFIFPEK